jgi:hypothetical protein
VTPAPAATPPPAVDPAPPVTTPPPPAVPPGTTPAPEDGATGAPPPTTTPTPADPPPATPPPPPVAVDPQRTPPPVNDATATAANVTTPAPATAVGAADREAVTANSVQTTTTSQPASPAVDAPALSPTGEDTSANAPSLTSGTSRNGTGAVAPTAGSGSAQASGAGGFVATGGTTTSGTAAGAVASLRQPLTGPATEAITRVGVREAQGTETSLPQASADGNVDALAPPKPTIAARVSDLVIHEVPRGVWIAMGALVLLVLILGANTMLAAARTRRLQRQRERLMEDIGLLQAALLPAIPPRMGALLTTVAYRPADGPAAGGDFYDAFALPDGKVGLLLGDVSGHGRQALAKTTLVRFTVRAHLEAGMSPREALSIAGRTLDGRLSDDFATVLAAIHDPATGTLTYSSAGHPPPLVLGPAAHPAITASSAPPIGAGFPTGQRQTIVPMPEGTTVAVYSDGLLEARIAGEPLGGERLAAWLAELGPDATAKQLLDLVVQRADRVPDDLAAVVLHAAPGATAPAARVEQLKLDVLDVEGPDLDGFLSAAGVSQADRVITGRKVSEQLAVTGGVIVEVRSGDHPTVNVYAIGESSPTRTSSPAR